MSAQASIEAQRFAAPLNVAADVGWDDKPSGKVISSWPVKRHRAKATIFCEAEPFRHACELLEGVVSLYRLTPDGRRQIIGFRYPGEFFGLEVKGCHAYTAEGITDVLVRQHNGRSLERTLTQRPELARRLLAMATAEILAAQEHVLLLGRKTATEKLATFLLRLSEANKARGEDPLLLHLPMSRADIGDYLGLTIETVSRRFTWLQQLGVLDLTQSRTVVIHDPDRLSELAEVGKE